MYHKIMVPLDGSELAECVLPHVEAIATGCNVSEVWLISVIEPLHLRGGLETRFIPEERERIEEDSMSVIGDYLGRMIERLKNKGVTAQSEVLYGHVAEKLVDYADSSGVDLIVIASHGRSGVSRWVRGSVADRILHSACVPVLIVRAPGCVAGL